MGRTYRAHKKKLRNRTFRGGNVEDVKRIIQETPVGNVHIINPNCKFVVATYVWGIANMNRNTQKPCPEEIDKIVEEKIEDFAKTINPPIEFSKEQTAILIKLNKVPSENLTQNQKILKNYINKRHEIWVKEKLMKNPLLQNDIKRTKEEVENLEFSKPGNNPPRLTFGEMIREWEAKCEAAGVNYVQINTEFERQDYQNAINGKPLFIKKILDAVAPRGVLYIDGDMWINKYPHIFDMDNVDFMARNWNIDCRSKLGAIEKPYYDPYTFETSGGTMFFGNTKIARDLLDKWERASAKQIGKADDRILSQVFTTSSLIYEVNTIGLPIEYLWLTGDYNKYLKDEKDPSSVKYAYIEHPLCLTGEDRATSQGASNNRMPDGYDDEVSENIIYERPTELFYEYIFFNGNESMVEEYKKYNDYMRTAINFKTNQPMLKIIDFKNKYGEFNTIANENLRKIIPNYGMPQITGTLTRRSNIGATSSANQGNKPRISLPFNPPIPEILKALYEGHDVEIGGPVPNVQPEDDVVGFNQSKTAVDKYTRTIQLDTSFPIYISSKSKIMWHALAMCKKLEDINSHIEGSYMFMSRIRWNLKSTPGPRKISHVVLPLSETGFVPRVNQIWFGGEMPEWRKYMFDKNKQICESHGFQYSLWTNNDRNQENFPVTLAYQEYVLNVGKETGQNRWAQVADLARLEIIYNVGGIYIDSLIEITPAFLKAVVDAFKAGFKFVGCNEDPCDPPTDCIGNNDRKYLSNSFFAATKGNPILGRLVSINKLDQLDLESKYINRTTGPYYLREGIEDVTADKVFMFESAQIFPFNEQRTPYKEQPVPNRFLSKVNIPGAVKVKEGMYYLPGGAELLQSEFLVNKKGPLAIYHSGLGGTWST